MKLQRSFDSLSGQWRGTSRLWMSPDDPIRDSTTAATVTTTKSGGFLSIAYTWAFDGQPQDGALVVRLDPTPGPDAMSWIDSFHTGGKFMRFDGEADPDGNLSALGSYSVPGMPEWGWRIVLAPQPDGFVLRMYNIAPDGTVYPAVEARYDR